MNLLDTDTIIEMLRERRHEVGAISIITLTEVLRGLEARKRAKVKELLEESFNLLNLDNEVIGTYCNLYHKLKEEGTLIPDADILIAATAITHNITLKTKDEHFERLTHLGLKLTQAPKKQRE
ncbi:MAG: PIN domain-containing protein [Candidatus Bathyarchaeia archaeon]